MRPKLMSTSWKHEGGARKASTVRLPHGSICRERANRSSPTGGLAYGMPRNVSTSRTSSRSPARTRTLCRRPRTCPNSVLTCTVRGDGDCGGGGGGGADWDWETGGAAVVREGQTARTRSRCGQRKQRRWEKLVRGDMTTQRANRCNVDGDLG